MFKTYSVGPAHSGLVSVLSFCGRDIKKTDFQSQHENCCVHQLIWINAQCSYKSYNSQANICLDIKKTHEEIIQEMATSH